MAELEAEKKTLQVELVHAKAVKDFPVVVSTLQRIVVIDRRLQELVSPGNHTVLFMNGC